jgi:hypothetical protein
VTVTCGALLCPLVAAAIVANSWYRATERTYYGPHSDILNIGERVVTAQSTQGIVQSDPAFDEDSCDPDRPISVRLDSGEIIALARHSLHR